MKQQGIPIATKQLKPGRGFSLSLGTNIARLAILLYVITVLLPLIWTITTSFKTTLEFYTSPFGIPSSLQFDNYVRAWQKAKVGTYFFNSVIVTVCVVALNVMLCSMVAYVLARFRFFGNRFLSILFTMGLMIPQMFLSVPTFITLMKVGMLDTYPGLIIVMLTRMFPFAIFLLQGFFSTLPGEVHEAATIDGANNFQVYFWVMFPMARPGWTTIMILNFISAWNDYINPLMYITTPDKQTLSVGLKQLSSVAQYASDWPALFAGLVIIMLPSLLVYALFSERLMNGMTSGAVKG